MDIANIPHPANKFQIVYNIILGAVLAGDAAKLHAIKNTQRRRAFATKIHGHLHLAQLADRAFSYVQTSGAFGEDAFVSKAATVRRFI